MNAMNEFAKPGGRSFLTAALRKAKVVRHSKHLRRPGMVALPRHESHSGRSRVPARRHPFAKATAQNETGPLDAMRTNIITVMQYGGQECPPSRFKGRKGAPYTPEALAAFGAFATGSADFRPSSIITTDDTMKIVEYEPSKIPAQR